MSSIPTNPLPAVSLNELSKRADVNPKGAAQYSTKYWVKSVTMLLEKAQACHDSNDLEAAYVHYLKACNIVTLILPTLPDYQAYVTEKSNLELREKLHTVYLPALEEITVILRQRSQGKSASQPGPLQSGTASLQNQNMDPFAALAALPPAPKHLPSATAVPYIHDRSPANLKPAPQVPPTSTKPSGYKSTSTPSRSLKPVGPTPSPTPSASPTLFATSPPPPSLFIPKTDTNFRQSAVISARDLATYLTRKKDPPSILLLDVRPRDVFAKRHIHGRWIVNIEPLVLKSGITSSKIESSLVLTNDREQSFFKARQNFDLIVYYDQSSTTNSEPLNNLVHAIYIGEFSKVLRRHPVLLHGGFDAWCIEVANSNGGVATLNERGEQMVVLEYIASAVVGKDNRTNGAKATSETYKDVVKPGGGATTTTRNVELTNLSRNDVISKKHGKVIAPVIKSTYDYFNNLGGSKQSMVQPSYSSAITAPYTTDMSSQSAQPTSRATSVQPQPSTSSSASAQPDLRSMFKPLPPGANNVQENARELGERKTHIDNPFHGFTTSKSAMYEPPPPVSKPSRILPIPPQPPQGQESQGSPRALLPTMPTAPHRPLPSVPSTSTNLDDRRHFPTFNASFSSVGDVSIGTTGLKNLGNTCFMNSVIQCLSGTIPLARFFYTGTYKKSVNKINTLGTQGVLADAFAELLKYMWSGQYTSVSPVTFRKALNRFAPQFAGGEQQDSQEFLAFFLDGLHEDLNLISEKPISSPQSSEEEDHFERLVAEKPWEASRLAWDRYEKRNKSIIVSLFQGQYMNRMTCKHCNKISTTYDSFMYLSLPIPATRKDLRSVNLLQCLDNFVSEETLDGENAWYCPRCKTRRSAIKRITLSRLPDVLLIHLKRFSWKGPFRDKLETMVTYPVQGLDLTRFLPGYAVQLELTKNGPVVPPKEGESMPTKGVFEYNLYAVSNHFGGINGGHYTACVRNGYRNQWQNFDDSRVSVCDESYYMSRSAYILFYVRTTV